MEISGILDERTMNTNMNVQSKEEALHVLAQSLLDNDYITDIEGFMKDIYAREEIGQTGIGNFIAIPHGKSDFVKEIGVAIGINQRELPWETLDDNGVKGIILFAVGNDNDGADNHLKLLSLFARKLGNDEVVEKLLQSQKTEDVKETFRD